MGFLRRQKKPAEVEPVSHAVDLGSSDAEDSDCGSDANCSAREHQPSVYNDKKALHSSEADWTCTVRPSRRGFFLHASTSIALPVPADAAFQLFFGGNILPWRHFEECSYIRVLEDNGAGRQLLEAEETVEFAFLHLHKTLHTRLMVTLDRPAGTMDFWLAEPGVLRRFEGRWRLIAAPSGGCELVIEQEVQPKWAPRPLRRRMRYALIAFCEFMLGEMRDEAARIATGRPPAGPRACDGVRAAEAETAASATAPESPAPVPRLVTAAAAAVAGRAKAAPGGGARPVITLAAEATTGAVMDAPCQHGSQTGALDGMADALGPPRGVALKRSVTFAADTRGGETPPPWGARPAAASAHCRVRSFTALCLVGGASSGKGVQRAAHSAPRLDRAASLPAQQAVDPTDT